MCYKKKVVGFFFGTLLCTLPLQMSAKQIEAKHSLKSLFRELVFRSHRAAKMMYEDAADTEKQLSWWTMILPGLSIAGLIQKIYVDFTASQQPTSIVYKYIGIFISLTACVAEGVVVTFPGSIKEYLQSHSEIYIKAASNWQKLEKEAEAYLILFNDQNFSIYEIHRTYTELLSYRANITASVIVSKKSYTSVTEEVTLNDILHKKKWLEKYEEEMDTAAKDQCDKEVRETADN